MKANQEKILVADGDRALIPQVLINAFNQACGLFPSAA
jgi:hypothetical protein